MQEKRVIFFNGPPRVGKDTAAKYARLYLRDVGLLCSSIKVSTPLKKAVHAMFGLDVGVDHFEDRKDKPCEEMFGAVPVEEYIELSEKYLKPRFGPDFFAKTAVNQIHIAPGVVIVSDCGFQAEVDAVIAEFGAKNVVVIQLHRPGTSFDNRGNGKPDSRHYVNPRDAVLYGIQNDSTLEEYEERVYNTLNDIIKHHWKF